MTDNQIDSYEHCKAYLEYLRMVEAKIPLAFTWNEHYCDSEATRKKVNKINSDLYKSIKNAMLQAKRETKELINAL